MFQGHLEPAVIKHALSSYISEARALLKLEPAPDEKAVHDIRVLMKKSRAVMKLISWGIDEEEFKKDYLAFREVGRITRSWRDTSVHRKTLLGLKKKYPELFTLLYSDTVLGSLMNTTDPVVDLGETLKDELWNIDGILNKAGYRIRFCNIGSLTHEGLIGQLEGTYEQVSDIYIRARNNPKPGNLHRFRKRAKDFLYQLFFFRFLNEALVTEMEESLDQMTQNLGKFNDLAQLIMALDYKYSGLSDQPVFDELILRIRDEQDSYLAKVWPAAYNIFCPGQKLVNLLG